MDASEKIIVFNSLEHLKQAIAEDVPSKDMLAQRYCVRFIMLNNFEVFRELSKFLKKEMDVELLDIEGLTYGDDKTVTMDVLSEAVCNVTNPTLITPFSEVVRFFKEDDFRGFFNDIILTERIKYPKLRIYVPIIGLHNRFIDFLKNFARIGESAPIWQYYTEKDDRVQVYVTKFQNKEIADALGLCLLPTMRDWLRFWKQQAPKNKILCGATPIARGHHNSKPDSIFTFNEIKDDHAFISDFLNINIPIEFKDEDAKYWNNILLSINKENLSSFNFRTLVCRHFNRLSLTFGDILELWADVNQKAYDRWLLKHYALTQDIIEQPYLKLCLEETNELHIANQLFVNIAERIFYVHKQSERELYFVDRYEMMQQHHDLFVNMVKKEHQDWIRDKIVEFAQADESLINVKKYCTSTFQFEYLLFMGWYAMRSNKGFGLEQLKQFYPDFYRYLKPMSESDVEGYTECTEKYFSVFKEAKVKDIYLPSVETIIAEQNKNEDAFYNWYYHFSESHALLSQVKDDLGIDKVYWVDGLGAEFLPYICQLVKVKQSRYDVIQAELARTTIPSNTHLNCFAVDNVTTFKFGDLDELAHGGHYKRYETLVNELNTIKHIVSSIIEENKTGNHTIAIVSDHGLTALSRLCDSKKMDADVKHEGRYIPLDDNSNSVSETDYIVHTNENDGKKYKVALTHSSLGKKPSHEVHGGCTPEEVLVPFIVISNVDNAKPVSYTIRLIENKVPATDQTVKVTIIPEPESVVLTLNGKSISMTNKSTIWTANLGNLTEGKYHVTIKPNKGKTQSFDVEVYGMGFGEGLLDDF